MILYHGGTYIMDHFHCGENDALKMFYESHIGKCYADDSMGLYGQSAAHIFSLFCDEISDEKNLH
jgi:hypothetical protein